MTLEEFLDHAKDLYRPWEGRSSFPHTDGDIERYYLWMRHCTGGMTGGSCWGTHSERFSTNESTPDFASLYELYEKICPNISFLQAKKIESKLVSETNTQDSSDYYGNFHEYLIKYIHLPSLYEYMIEAKLICE